MATTVTLRNPWSGVYVERDITGITAEQVDSYALDEDVRSDLHAYGYETPEEYLAAYVERVGAEKAGIQIIGA